MDTKWTDRERVLLLCSRGSTARTRHIMNDLKSLMPHVHCESKFEKGKELKNLNEVGELANCTQCVYFENRKHRDLYLWLSDFNNGPSVKFLVHNLHTMSELNMAGNCLKGSRPILSFDSQFSSQPHLKLIKELLINIFKTPQNHPRSQPFIDHILNFSVTTDGNIWFRNYQIVNDAAKLEEIGPRMVWEIIRVFDNSFYGSVLYENPNYKDPNTLQRELKAKKALQGIHKQEQKEAGKVKEQVIRSTKILDVVGEVFDTDVVANQNLAGEASVLDRKILKTRNKDRAKKARKELNAAKKSRIEL